MGRRSSAKASFLAFLVLIARDANTALIVLAFASPVPYNVFMVVAKENLVKKFAPYASNQPLYEGM